MNREDSARISEASTSSVLVDCISFCLYRCVHCVSDKLDRAELVHIIIDFLLPYDLSSLSLECFFFFRLSRLYTKELHLHCRTDSSKNWRKLEGKNL